MTIAGSSAKMALSGLVVIVREYVQVFLALVRRIAVPELGGQSLSVVRAILKNE